MSESSSWFGVQLLAVICLTSLVTPVVSSPPHIIFVVADDLGWNDVGWHNPAMITPNLNRFARNGVILNSSYVQYYCSPNFTMLPQLLKKVGYKTHVVGKMMHAVDWFPTILYLAGSQPDSKIDGVNQWDMLSTGGDSKREEFVYNIDTILNSTAIRYKDYKLMTGSPGIFNDWYPLPKDDVAMPPSPEYFDDGQLADVVSKKKRNPRLYNIRLDPEERNDLSETEPDMMTFMMNRLQQWMKSGVPPQNSPSDPKGDPKNWGWNDVGWHNPAMITPNLNRFARNGVILNSSYVQYYCSPSRNAFMTGYFPYHTGLQHGVILEGQPRYVPSNFTMLPQLLKKVGYKTHIVGK
nr:hypothetical protein BaRGS_020692 [Batillaria attramentaria]